MTGKEIKEFAASSSLLPQGYARRRDADPNEPLELSIYLKPHTRIEASALPVEPAARRTAINAHLAAEHEADVKLVRQFAERHALTVTSVETPRRLVKVAGTANQMQAAFTTRLATYGDGKKEFRSHEGALHLPEYLLDSVQSVLGLDNRPVAKPLIVRAAASDDGGAYWPNKVGDLYNFPRDGNGLGQCIALLEFGGGYEYSDVLLAFENMILPIVPEVVSVSVDGAENNPGHDHKADEEVALDIQVAGGNAPGAEIAVYFAPDNFQGFADAITQAANDPVNDPSVISISWGWTEQYWNAGGPQAMQTVNTALEDAATRRVTCFAGAGDTWATCGADDGTVNVLSPASSPWIIGCGGTTIESSDGTITSEVVWNTDTGGTGGGVSDYFPLPPYQQGFPIPPNLNDHIVRRGVPDVAADANRLTGYNIVVHGEIHQLGGTSAVAPLWAGLTALMNQALPTRPLKRARMGLQSGFSSGPAPLSSSA